MGVGNASSMGIKIALFGGEVGIFSEFGAGGYQKSIRNR